MRTRAGGSTAARSGVGELMRAIEQIGRERGIDVEILVSALEDAMTAASRKQLERRSGPAAAAASAENLVTRLNRQSGQIQVFARKRIVEQPVDPALEVTLAEARELDPQTQLGGTLDLARPTLGLGRVEAQAAKQVILQKVREAEREIVYDEYAPKVGELVHGTVKRFERGDIVLEVGRTEAILPRRAQSRIETFSQGDRVRALLIEVSRDPRSPQLVVSRTETRLVLKLFEMEVPEVYDGTVQLRQAAREPGERVKVAVASRQREVDPVGACVGVKGTRVQAIIRELRGEKIDIIPWADDHQTFAAQALSPARVIAVAPAPIGEGLLVEVDDQQLSLAIGKRGQNVRLAARLVGRPIEMKGHEERQRAVDLPSDTAPADGQKLDDGPPEVGQLTATVAVEQRRIGA